MEDQIKAPAVEDQLLRIEEVEAIVKFSRQKIYRDMASGTFPSPMKAGRTSLWRLSDINAWIRALTPAK